VAHSDGDAEKPNVADQGPPDTQAKVHALMVREPGYHE